MSRKVIFLDIDGTLCNEYGVVPPSAIEACQQARANGHQIFLCTGRSKIEIYDFIMEIGFDGVIGAAGGYIELDGEILRHIKMSESDLSKIKTFCESRGIHYLFESNSGIFASLNCSAYLSELFEEYVGVDEVARLEKEKGLDPFLEAIIECENPVRDDVNKVAFLHSKTTVDEVVEFFKDQFHIIPGTVPAYGPNSGEIMIPGIHKAQAIETLLQHLGVSREETIAFGDGMNDVEMLQFVNIGIAMGNAKDAVKQYANDITDHVDEDGLYNGFKKLNLI